MNRKERTVLRIIVDAGRFKTLFNSKLALFLRCVISTPSYLQPSVCSLNRNGKTYLLLVRRFCNLLESGRYVLRKIEQTINFCLNARVVSFCFGDHKQGSFACRLSENHVSQGNINIVSRTPSSIKTE